MRLGWVKKVKPMDIFDQQIVISQKQ